MLARPLLAAALVLGILVAPLASAAEAVEGTARGESAPRLSGVGAIQAPDGTLDLGDAAGTAGVQIAWDSAEGTLMTHQENVTAGRIERDAVDDPATIAWGAGTLTGVRCAADCIVRLSRASGDAGALGLRGALGGTPALTRATRAGSASAASPFGPPARLAVPMDASWLVARAGPGEPGFAVPDGTPLAAGDATLTLWNATATLTLDGAGRALATGLERAAAVGAMGQSVEEHVVSRWLVVHVRGLRVDAAPGSGARLAGPALLVDLDGAASWPLAEGDARVAGRTTLVAGETLDVAGPRLALRVASPGTPPASDTAPAITSTRFSGEATSVRVGGRELVAPEGAPARGSILVASAAAGLAAIALWTVLRAGAWAALYSRITRSSLLANDNRMAAYERILAAPGMHVSQIARELGLGRVVLQHHLRMLEAHHLVVARTTGRVKAYYPVGTAGDAREIRVDAALKDETRRRVLMEVEAAPEGLTQKEIAARTGASPRLVSYHLARLLELRLVGARGRDPRTFVVEKEVAAPSVVGAAGAGNGP